MFPHIIVAIKGLDPEERYTVAMEILDADNRRYKYVKNQWMAMGTADPGPARHVYVHPDSPNSGAVWTKNCVSFAKVRLTNNKESKESVSRARATFFSRISHNVNTPKRLNASILRFLWL